jgi:hypothetical protein
MATERDHYRAMIASHHRNCCYCCWKGLLSGGKFHLHSLGYSLRDVPVCGTCKKKLRSGVYVEDLKGQHRLKDLERSWRLSHGD